MLSKGSIPCLSKLSVVLLQLSIIANKQQFWWLYNCSKVENLVFGSVGEANSRSVSKQEIPAFWNWWKIMCHSLISLWENVNRGLNVTTPKMQFKKLQLQLSCNCHWFTSDRNFFISMSSLEMVKIQVEYRLGVNWWGFIHPFIHGCHHHL